MKQKRRKKIMGSRIPVNDNKKFDEYITTFRKEQDGTYTKQTKKVSRDRVTSSVKYYKKDNPVIEDGPYVLVTSEDEYDETQSFEDFDGNNVMLYFKKLNNE